MPASPPRLFERIGHRGAPRELPENTLEGFARALERGADAVELDVHATSDGVCVVHHDPALGRAVDASVVGTAIAAMPWSQLQRVELAPGISLPSLQQVLEQLAGRAIVYVEIKAPKIEKVVATTIAASNARCAVHSFDHDTIGRMARIAPDIRRGILFDEPPVDVRRSMISAGAVDVWPHWQLIDEAFVHVVHEAGGRVIPWTVNAPTVAERLLAMGVDGICSDDLRLLPRRA
jgi:glycerophosphoryl diester phosphodiesterase